MLMKRACTLDSEGCQSELERHDVYDIQFRSGSDQQLDLELWINDRRRRRCRVPNTRLLERGTAWMVLGAVGMLSILCSLSRPLPSDDSYLSLWLTGLDCA